MEYKVCILAAGKGSRVSYSKIINKAILPVGDKSTISYIIEKFPKNIEIVIPLGYNADQLKDFISLAHPDRKITFVDVDNWDQPGSGPGYSLLCCKPHLDGPFIFTSCDTIVLEDVPEPNRNWIGVAPVSDSKDFCIAEVFNGLVRTFYDKVETHILLKTCLDYKTILDNAFIGMAGVHDYKEFWNALEGNKGSLIKNELQVSNGLNRLVEKRLEAVPFTWFDTGSQASYEYTNRYFNQNRVLMKDNEFIYFENDLVIKYFSNENVVQKRVDRAKLLQGLVPEVSEHKKNFYAYKLVNGKTLPKVLNKKVFADMLNHYKNTLWQEKILLPEDRIRFQNACYEFYKTKTEKRLKSFYEKTGIKDQEETINGIRVPTLSSLLVRVDWDDLKYGVPVLFHGDFQPENILITPDDKFMLIDWRQDFNGIIEFGDIYYDLAKLYHALIICGEIIRNNYFEIKIKGDNIEYNYLIKGNLQDYRIIFEKFIKDNKYDLHKVKVLTSLIFLNIAPLHHEPYNKLLYYLGKSMLFENLEEGQKCQRQKNY